MLGQPVESVVQRYLRLDDSELDSVYAYSLSINQFIHFSRFPCLTYLFCLMRHCLN